MPTTANKRPVAKTAKKAGSSATKPAAKSAKAQRPAKSATKPAAFDLASVMSTLEKAGTGQTAKTYRRHGVVDPVFGVSFATLKGLAKAIKTDHDLAERLWATRNFDARNLAIMIADPAAFDDAAADRWLNSVNCHCACGMFAGLIARSPAARSRVNAWIESKAEHTLATGYDLVAAALKETATGKNGAASLDTAFLSALLGRIEREIHAAPNRARYSMNSAVIAIGGWHEPLRDKALAAAKRIGTVDVDHGDTDCKTPDAQEYIKKIAARAAKASRR